MDNKDLLYPAVMAITSNIVFVPCKKCACYTMHLCMCVHCVPRTTGLQFFQSFSVLNFVIWRCTYSHLNCIRKMTDAAGAPVCQRADQSPSLNNLGWKCNIFPESFTKLWETLVLIRDHLKWSILQLVWRTESFYSISIMQFIFWNVLLLCNLCKLYLDC